MKKLTKYILALAALASAFSCARFEEENIPQETQKVSKTFSALFADEAQTKTMVDGAAGDSWRNTMWLPEDEIAVIARYGTDASLFHNTLQEVSNKASFTGTTTLADSYYALFPYQSGVTIADDKMNVTLQKTQTYAKESFGPKAMPMVANIYSGDELYFKNLCGGFIVNITGTETIKSIQFIGYDETGHRKKVSGDFMVDMTYEVEPVLTETGNGNTAVTLDCGTDGVQLSEDESTSFHIVLPPATYNGFSLIITTTDGKRMQKKVDKDLTIKRANLTNAAAFAFEENFFGFDLSANGTANSYVVSGQGYYHFDATVIGNGEFGMLNSSYVHTTDPTISPSTVEVLWQDTQDVITGVEFDGHEINFTATGTEGNALIAAKDENGDIIWSWHIWATDEPQEHIYVNDLGTFTVLDRNIGAIRADGGTSDDDWHESMGVVYQKGRKDPFYLPKMSMDSHYDYTTVNTQFSIEESIQLPTHFPYGYENWNTNYMEDSYWSYSKKTIYDPCPVGYRVATSDVWYGFTYNGESADRWDEIFFSGEFNNGWNFYYDNTNNTAWYPATERIGYWGDHGTTQNEGRLWHAGPSGNGLRYENYSEYECAFNRQDWFSRVEGYQVRCMKDENVNPIIISTNAVTDRTASSATVSGRVSTYGQINIIETGFVYGLSESVTLENGTSVKVGDSAGDFSAEITGLAELTKYYVRAYVTTDKGTSYGIALSFITPNAAGIVNLSLAGTANSYMVYPVEGTYTFDLVQGNSSTSVGNVASVEVLWETLNTTDAVSVGDVIESVELDGSQVKFTIPEDAVAGNALIAAKNSGGKILWSWHIWVVDMDADATGVVYPSGAKFMDRNLGALTNKMWIETNDPMMPTNGYDVRSFGLFYQWGRKDPFVGAGDTWGGFATTTLGEKTYVDSGSDTNTLSYATSHPTTVISNSDWNRDASLWGMVKTIYDPCPVGWRVPDNSAWDNSSEMGSTYPLAGYTDGTNYSHYVGEGYYVWSSYNDGYSYYYHNGGIHSMWSACREQSVRCVKDANFSVTTGEAINITEVAVTLAAEIEILDGTTIDVCGFLIRENSSDLSFNDSNVQNVECGSQTGSFSKAVTGLKPNMTYYFKAYAKGNYNTRYGETFSFKTKASGSGDGFNDGGDFEWE